MPEKIAMDHGDGVQKIGNTAISDEPVPMGRMPAVAKHRNGPTGQISLMFLPQYTRFEMAAKISAADVPQGR